MVVATHFEVLQTVLKYFALVGVAREIRVLGSPTSEMKVV
jgi:hypothetical protein